jgi:hypothetical protein
MEQINLNQVEAVIDSITRMIHDVKKDTPENSNAPTIQFQDLITSVREGKISSDEALLQAQDLYSAMTGGTY